METVNPFIDSLHIVYQYGFIPTKWFLWSAYNMINIYLLFHLAMVTSPPISTLI